MKLNNLISWKHYLVVCVYLTGLLSTNFSTAQSWTPYNYWTFDGSNPLSDSIGHSALNPNYFGSPYYSISATTPTSVGKSLTLNNVSRDIVASSPLNADTAFTVEFLFKPSANIYETTQIFGRRDGAIGIRFAFPFIRFSTSCQPTGSTSITNDDFDIPLQGIGRGTYGYYVDGNWHHMVFKYYAKTGLKEVWVDGQCPTGFSKTLPTGVVPPNTTNTNNNICDINTNTTYYLYFGSLDEIAIYTLPLSSNMIYQHYLDFTQNKHYSFANSTVTVPTASAITSGIDITEYAPGHPTPTVDALTQLKNFPASRYKPGNTLFPNVPVFSPAYLAGLLTTSYTNATLVQRSKDFQTELVTNYNYTLMVSGSTQEYENVGDTTTFDGAWIKMANSHPTWKTSTNSYWPQLSPKDAGYTSKTPYVSCSCSAANTYLRNAAGSFLDMYGNVVTYKTLSPEAPIDSLTLDGLTQRFYLDQLTKKMTRPLDLIFENGEIIPFWPSTGTTLDPTVSSAYNSSGLSWSAYEGKSFTRLVNGYKSAFVTLPAIANTRFTMYQTNGQPQYSWNYSQTRVLNTLIGGQYYSSGDLYMESPANWRYWSGPSHGWQWLIDSRYPEITLGDKLFSPTVSAGWSNDETQNPRPAQWLGFLKAVAMTGAEYFNTGYFITKAPYQSPDNYIWEMAMSGYAQSITSRYEDILRNGTLLSGDIPNNIISNASQPGYMFAAGDVRKLVVARKSDSKAMYAITGTIQPNSNMIGNAELTGTATVKIDGNQLTFPIRRQGSTYIFDNTNTAAPVFYQLDGWQEASHPYYWSKTFKIEGELFDNTNANLQIKTEVPTGTTVGDYSNFTSYVAFKAVGASAEYNFVPRGTAATHYLWLRARSKGAITTGLTIALDGVTLNSINCVTDSVWTWYCYDATSSLPISFANLSLQNHKITLTSTGTTLEVDQITITPVSGNYYTSFAAPCNHSTFVATITPSSTTTFCQGGSVALTATTGTSYLWSNGATTNSINATTSGTYIVTVSNGTSNAVSPAVTVTVNPLPGTGITAGSATTFCSGSSVVLTASASSAGYTWSNGATTQSITASTTGTYSVTATSSLGCSSVTPGISVTAIIVTPATVSAGSSTTFCKGGAVALTANAGTSYLWSSGATTQSISATTTGNFNVTVTYNTGCTSTSSNTVVTANNVPANTVTTSGPTTFCNGGSVLLTASAGSTYKWSTNATTQAVAISSTGSYTVTVTNSFGCSSISTPVNVTVNIGSATPATITPAGSTTFCQGGSVLLNTVTGSSYLWSNGATTSSISVASTGNYAVTVTQSNGCSSSSSATPVTVNALPVNTVTASGLTTICTGSSVTLTSNATSSTYKWSTGATTSAIVVSSTGNYSVTVTGTNGCSTTSTPIAVTVSASAGTPTISSSGATTFCSGGNVTLTSSSGTSYLWSNGATTPTINVNTSGSYSVSVTQSGGCSAASTPTSVTVNALPNNAVTTSGSTTFCNGGNVILTSAAPTGTYHWSNGATTSSTTITTAGNYSVTVTGTNGCSVTSSPVTVTVLLSGGTPTVTSSGSTTFCSGGSVSLTGSAGASYLWSNGATTSTINVSTGGNYNVTITQIGGCSSTSAITTVTIKPTPSNIVNASGPTSFCSGGSVTLTSAATSGPYAWSNGAITPSITVATTGSYSVTVNNNGCSATSTPIAVTASSGSGTAAITAGGATTFCSGLSVVLTANNGTSFLWSNGATTQAVTAASTGNYSVTVSQSGGCSATSTPTVVTVNPRATFNMNVSGPLSFCNGGSVTLTVSQSTGNAYVWYKNNVVISTATSTTYTANQAGTYKVRVQLGSCGSFSNPYTVTIPCREGETMLEGAGISSFIAYPNPFNEQTTFAFTLPEETAVSIRLFDATGKLIDVIMDNSMMPSGESKIDYPTSHLQEGMYFAEITTNGFKQRIRVIAIH